jgi:ADP-heptose:LPS heptosyltransferase
VFVNHVVVLRALKLGDLLVAVPALRAVRRAWPRHEIMLATAGWLRPLVHLGGCADTILPVDGLTALPRHAARPDVAVNLHGAGPESHAVLDALSPVRRVGHRASGWNGPQWTDEVPERERWCRLLRAHGVPADAGDFLLPRPEVDSPAPDAIVLHPGAAHGSRRWPIDRFAEVALGLLGDGHRVVITGSAAEQPLAAGLARLIALPDRDLLAGQTGLPELAALVADARLVISGDTGIAHLAYAYRTPSVTLFGPLPAHRWGPPPDGPHRTLSADAQRRGEAFADRPDPALLGVTVADVLAAARDLR